MSVIGYQGLPGSGKSYQVTTHVIVNALRAGRRVVTNIDGIHHGVISAYLVDNGIAQSDIGILLHVEDAIIRSKDFWYSEDNPDSIIQPGDVVVIDEAWNFFEDGEDIPPLVMHFFRYHRHYVHPKSGLSCEIVLITQDIMDIGRKVRRVIEQTVSITKLKELGSDKTFRLDIYSKCKVRSKPVYSEISRYNPAFFAFYDSYEKTDSVNELVKGSKKSREKGVEGRGTLFNSAFFKYLMPLALILFIGSVWYGYHFFANIGTLAKNNFKSPEELPKAEAQPVPPPFIVPTAPGEASPRPPFVLPGTSPPPPALKLPAADSMQSVSQPVAQPQQQLLVPSKPKPSDKYQLTGFYSADGVDYLVISAAGRSFSVKDDATLNPEFLRPSAVYQGDLVSNVTGPSSSVSPAAAVVAPLSAAPKK